MRQVAKKGLITVVATGGVLAVTGGYAYADAGAAGASAAAPGVLSGNVVQVPVNVPVNVCGDTVDVVGALNPAFGNQCGNVSRRGAGAAVGGGSTARGGSVGSPGVASGNTVQVPVQVPVNACGDSVDVVGVLNPTFGDHCGNDSAPQTPARPTTPRGPAPTRAHVLPAYNHAPKGPQLAETGAAGALGLYGGLGAASVLGGYVLYRRGRAMRG